MADKYPSLAALKAALREKVDYSVSLLDRHSWASIISPHGGFIEPGTSALARAVASSSYNLFDFQGLRAEAGSDLHVTATRFRDPDLLTVLRRSCVAVSLHSMGPSGEPVVWLGGRNKDLKDLVLSNLRLHGFAVNPDSPLYRGESPRNIVNLAACEGVQLELSDELVAQLFEGAAFRTDGKALARSPSFATFTGAIRLALRHFKKTHVCHCPKNDV